MNFKTSGDAKRYADEYRHLKVWGLAAPAGRYDFDPGTDGPTDPSPPPDDPTENDIEVYVLARLRRTLWEIKTAWEAGA